VEATEGLLVHMGTENHPLITCLVTALDMTSSSKLSSRRAIIEHRRSNLFISSQFRDPVSGSDCTRSSERMTEGVRTGFW
jgi:hypothetical protein